MSHSTRRRFLRRATQASMVAGAADLAFLSGLRPVSATEAKLDSKYVQFRPEIEPLVRLIEETPREKLLEEIGTRIRKGLTYKEVLTALLLAGVRNVQPRPAVGFKFHAVLVVNSAHLASMASADHERWLPIFWALDYFKSSQERDVQENDWTMAAVDESAVPSIDKAQQAFHQAMDQWDVRAADTATAGFSRTAGANQIFEAFARYGIRDFRSIGHKAIFVANSWRTLQCIGWRHSEPVLRSLAYALLNHENEPNPATSELDADRPWRDNQELAPRIRVGWQQGKLESKATYELLDSLRTADSKQICEQVVEMLNADVSPKSIYDAMFVGSAEMLMRQPGIVALHASTTTNAMHYAFNMVADDETRKLILLQNAAFLPKFRQAMAGRGAVGDHQIDNLEPETPGDVSKIFHTINHDRLSASRQLLGFLQEGGSAEEVMTRARQLIFLKGTDSHDYKFSSAVLEDFYSVSKEIRNRFLAASVFKLRGSDERDNGLVERIESSLRTSTLTNRN